jgi:hypothetical protein
MKLGFFSVGLAMLLAATSCLHDWDSLDGGGGSAIISSVGGSGGTPTGGNGGATTMGALCTRHCELWNNCATNDPDCGTKCAAAIATCPSVELANLSNCLDDYAATCGTAGDEGFYQGCTALSALCFDWTF